MQPFASVEEAFAQRDTAMRSLVACARDLAKQLQSLPDASKDAVVSLVALDQLITSYARSRARPDQRIVSAFGEAVGTLSPPAAARYGLATRALAFRDESIAYTSAMATSLANGSKTEARCERECTQALGAEITCMLRQVEGLKGIIGDLSGVAQASGAQRRP